MVPTIVLPRKGFHTACHRTLAHGHNAVILSCLVMALVDVAVELSFRGVPSGKDRALKWLGGIFAVVTKT